MKQEDNIPKQLEERKILFPTNHKDTKLENTISLTSYNILAPSAVEEYLYPDTPAEHLDPDTRQASILSELKFLKSNIYCLQEVDKDRVQIYEESMKECGYESIYNSKRGMEKQDGCLTLFDSSRFNKIDNWVASFKFENGVNYNKEDMLTKEMYYPSVGQFVLLEEIKSNRKLLVVNTHLLFNKNRGHLKLGMLVLILKISEVLQKGPAAGASFVMAGDFNLVPNSMLYNWLMGGSLNLGVDLREYSNQSFFMKQVNIKSVNDIATWSNRKYKVRYEGNSVIMSSFLIALLGLSILPQKNGEINFLGKENSSISLDIRGDAVKEFNELILRFKLSSCYPRVIKNSEQSKDQAEFCNEPLITHFTKDVGAAMDYIFISKIGLKVIAVQDVNLESILRKEKRNHLPNDKFPSDHISLTSFLEFKEIEEDY